MSVNDWTLRLDLILDGVDPRGVLHLGAHNGAEVLHYKTAGFDRVVLVEPIPKYAAALREVPGVEVVEAAISSEPGRRVFYLTEYDEGSSLLRPLYHPIDRLVEVDAVRLADLNLEGLNVAVLDVQGSELDALNSGPLDGFEVLIVEGTARPRYAGGATVGALDRYLTAEGFTVTGRYHHPHSADIIDTAYRRT